MNRVAVIDDSTVVRKIVEISLRRIGITCISYEDGFEALSEFKKGQSPIPDLIFLDIDLPKLDGYDLLRLFKTSPQFDRTVVVMLSGHDRVLDRVKSRLAGARGYITKPFTTQDLVSVVLSCLDQSTLEASLN
jgi:twitching motility two-component system response regulator PilG